MSFGLLNYFFPLFPLLRPLFPIGHPIFLKSFLTSSSHLTLGLPFGLVAYGFHLYMVLATLSLVILSTCPNQTSRLYFIYLTIFSLLIAFSISSFVLSLHSPFAFCVGPNILLNIFLPNANNFCLMFSVKTQHSDPYTTTGLIRNKWHLVGFIFNYHSDVRSNKHQIYTTEFNIIHCSCNYMTFAKDEYHIAALR